MTAFVSALFLGPVGAVAAIVFGWAGRRDAERAGRRGGALATAGMLLGALMIAAWGALLALAIASGRLSSPVAHAAERPAPAEEPARAAIGEPPLAAPLSAPAPRSIAPHQTRVVRHRAISVVDVGVTTPSLAEELAKQRAAASLDGETLLLMTIVADCGACKALDAALDTPMMQTALAGVRIVRVDVEAFREDLDALKVPQLRTPGFFLLSLDLGPRDGIDGGEWDDDVAANMAPILGAFVRGKYEARRQTWHPPAGTGVRL